MTNREALEQAGFRGFLRVRELRETELAAVPAERGVYVFLRDTTSAPSFLTRSTGGRHHRDGQDPSVSIDALVDAWVPGSSIVYIGKAGRAGGKSNLRSRLGTCLRFGAGKPVPHWGGRYIWQLADAEELVVCWALTGEREPAILEGVMLIAFEHSYGKRPFANRKTERTLAV